MPISDDLSPRNFITKIVKYDKVGKLLLPCYYIDDGAYIQILCPPHYYTPRLDLT